jgi:hypothetical protein
VLCFKILETRGNTVRNVRLVCNLLAHNQLQDSIPKVLLRYNSQIGGIFAINNIRADKQLRPKKHISNESA